MWPWILVIVLGAVASLAVPWKIGALASHPKPVTTFAEASERVASLREGEASRLRPDCLVRLMTHGDTAERAIVFVHGYTTCPRQFDALGKTFFELGYNVLIAPLPHHGLTDRLNTEQSHLTAEELTAYGDQVVDIAHALGQHLTLAGISGGGVVAAWAAQNRRDIDLVVSISPAFGFKQIPTPLTSAAMNVMALLPNSFAWWDPVLQVDGGLPYAYPRYSTHALIQFMRLGFSVQAAARRIPPAAKQILVITNGNEPSVNNELAQRMVAIWSRNSANVSLHELPADWQLPHDLIDPSQPDQKIELVYPVLIDLITQPPGIAQP